MKNKNPNAVLFISYYFPPIQSVGVIRNYNLAKQFLRYTEKIIVLTTTNYKRLPQDPFPQISLFQLVYLFTFDYRTLLSLKSTKTAHHSEEKKEHPLIKFGIRLFDSFPFNILLGEGGLFYIIAGFVKGSAFVKKEKVEIIYSSFRPYSDHVIAYLLKKRFPNLKWVADFKDLHIDVNRKNIFLPKLQIWFNNKVISKADQVLTVSEGLAKNLQQYHSNTYVLRSGIPELEGKLATKSYPKFTISYTGSIYKGFQTPELLLQVLKDLIAEGHIDSEDLQIFYAGKDGPVWQNWISNYSLLDNFTDHGFITRKEAISIQQQSHINLLLSWAGPELSGILTGKLYEYLAARNPILLLINGSQDLEFESLFKNLNAGKVVYNNENDVFDVKAWLLQHYQEWKTTGKIYHITNEEELKEFTWPNLFDRFWKHLSQ